MPSWHTAEEYAGALNAYEQQQRKMLENLRALEAPPRLQQFKDEVLSAGEDQIRFYEEFAQAKITNNDLNFNAFSSNLNLKTSDQKLHAAYDYLKTLYPSIDKATNDAIEQRICWFDII